MVNYEARQKRGTYLRTLRERRKLDIEGVVYRIHQTQQFADMYWTRGRWWRWVYAAEQGGTDFDASDVARIALALELTRGERAYLARLHNRCVPRLVRGNGPHMRGER
jgi:hypothetical protein